MIQLAVFGATQIHWEEVAPRLLGATLRIGADFETCDAILIADPVELDEATIERVGRTGKPALVFAQAGLTHDWIDMPNLTIVNPDRYLPSRQLIRQQLDAGKLGDPGLLRLHRWTPPGHDYGGAILRDLDLALWYFGKPPDLVYAVGQADLQLHLDFPGGGMALLDHFRHLPAGASYCSLSLIGSAGAAYVDDHQNMQLLYCGGAPQAVRTIESMAATAALVQDFVDGIATGRDWPAQRAAWHDVLRVSDAAPESLMSKLAVALNGGAP
jgi:hypothetical protein